MVRSASGAVFKVPAVMRLIKLIRTLYRTGVAFCKKNVFIRDGFKCAYCGTHKVRLTIDHIIPKSRGGISSFENCVAACKPCNIKKGHQTPREANMFLNVRPVQPTISEFLRLKLQKLGINDLLRDLGVYWAQNLLIIRNATLNVSLQVLSSKFCPYTNFVKSGT